MQLGTTDKSFDIGFLSAFTFRTLYGSAIGSREAAGDPVSFVFTPNGRSLNAKGGCSLGPCLVVPTRLAATIAQMAVPRTCQPKTSSLCGASPRWDDSSKMFRSHVRERPPQATSATASGLRPAMGGCSSRDLPDHLSVAGRAQLKVVQARTRTLP